jgi:predicted PurR-regulated permease PerM
MQDVYLRPILEKLLNVFNESMQADLDSNTTTTVTIFIIFIIMLVFIYLLFWLPLANKINREVPYHPKPKVRRTTMLLSMIPLNLI